MKETELVKEVADLLRELVPTIADEFRAWDDSDENDLPSMLVTIGVDSEDGETIEGWGWQTGDNSYTGGAYGYAFWGVGALMRDSDCDDLAEELVAEAMDQAAIYADA